MSAGLEREQIEYIARKGSEVLKVARRDLALVCAKQLDGATTVSATALLAHLAGISVFVTGGVGGVHRCARAPAERGNACYCSSCRPCTSKTAGGKHANR